MMMKPKTATNGDGKMNNDMKCPFCNGELVGTIGHPICRNQNCVMCDDPMPQDLLEELIRTRKALDVAVDAINKILVLDSGKFIQEPAEMWKIAKSAKDKITALE